MAVEHTGRPAPHLRGREHELAEPFRSMVASEVLALAPAETILLAPTTCAGLPFLGVKDHTQSVGSAGGRADDDFSRGSPDGVGIHQHSLRLWRRHAVPTELPEQDNQQRVADDEHVAKTCTCTLPTLLQHCKGMLCCASCNRAPHASLNLEH